MIRTEWGDCLVNSDDKKGMRSKAFLKRMFIFSHYVSLYSKKETTNCNI